MIDPPELIANTGAFLALRDECEKIIDTRKRLPDSVFRRAFDRYFCVEYVHIYRPEFGYFLLSLSKVFDDNLINYMTVEPDPIEYYHKNLSFFGVASFKPLSLAERYVPVMSREGNVNSFLLRGGDIGVFWGSSLKWGIFCDRISWEMAVIAVTGDIDVPGISGFRCMDAAWLSSYMDSQYHWNLDVSKEFTKQFLSNYPI